MEREGCIRSHGCVLCRNVDVSFCILFFLLPQPLVRNINTIFLTYRHQKCLKKNNQ